MFFWDIAKHRRRASTHRPSGVMCPRPLGRGRNIAAPAVYITPYTKDQRPTTRSDTARRQWWVLACGCVRCMCPQPL